MTSAAAIARGWRTLARAPAIALAEIAWRWTYGIAALAIVAWAFFRFLQSIPVSNTDLLLLNTMVPELMAQAVENIVRGSGARLAMLAAILLPGLLLLWIPVATAGRAATLRALLHGDSRSWRALLGLHILRAALWLATNFAIIGTLIFAGYAALWWGAPGDPTVFLLVFFCLTLGISFISSALWWYLALAPIFAWADALSTFDAIAEARHFAQRQARVISGVSLLFAVLRLAAMIAATLVALMCTPLLGPAVRPLGVGLLILITVGYFAVVDTLYAARLGAYVAIMQGERLPAYLPPATIDEPRVRLVLEA